MTSELIVEYPLAPPNPVLRPQVAPHRSLDISLICCILGICSVDAWGNKHIPQMVILDGHEFLARQSPKLHIQIPGRNLYRNRPNKFYKKLVSAQRPGNKNSTFLDEFYQYNISSGPIKCETQHIQPHKTFSIWMYQFLQVTTLATKNQEIWWLGSGAR